MKKIYIILAIVLLVSIIFTAWNFIGKFKDKPMDTRALKQTLEKSSDLTAAKLKMRFIKEFKDDGHQILDRSDFVMVYDAMIRAGIDISEIEIPEDKVDKTNKIVYIYLPKAKILDEPMIDPESLKFYDKKFALFNLNKDEDVARALAEATNDAKEQALNTGLIELADNQSEALIKGILSSAVGECGYSVEIIRK